MTWRGPEPIGDFNHWMARCLPDLFIQHVEPILANMRGIRISAVMEIFSSIDQADGKESSIVSVFSRL
jgi:hypothetical protein